jgi:hypothetical protein
MSVKKRSAIFTWWPAIVVGAVIAELIYFSTTLCGLSAWSWYVLITILPLGGMVGYSTLRGAYGIYKALRAGRWLRITCWTIFSAIICIAICIMIKCFTPDQFPKILPENLTLACLVWAALGMALALIGLGEEYLDDYAGKNRENTAPQ